MLRRILFLHLCALHLLPMANAQSDSTFWGSVQIGSGTVYWGGGIGLTPAQISSLTPGSTLLARDLSDHTFGSYAGGGDAAMLDLSLGIHPFRKAGRRGPELRLGVLYMDHPDPGAGWFRTDTTPYDTLTSSQTGQQYFVDSVYRSRYTVEYSARSLGLNASLVWRTPGRFSLTGGVGLMGGASFDARTEVFHTELWDLAGPAVHDTYQQDQQQQREVFRNKSGWWAGTYAVLGADYRLSRVHPFWSHLHLFMEFRPSLFFQGSPELGSSTTVGGQGLFGMRYTF